MTRISWHPAFVQAIEKELEDCRNDLTFVTEYQLTSDPLRIDVLIIKKNRNVAIKKNIARIFRSHNVVEYKSPNDRVTIEDYDKTHCYSRLYASLNKVFVSEMSVTIIVQRYPRKLMAFLEDQYTVQNFQPGIYFVFGDTSPTQIIVSSELSEEDNLWLRSLRTDLSAAQFGCAIESDDKKLPMDAYFHVLNEANTKALEELLMQRKKGVILSEKLDAYFREAYQPYIAQGEARGKEQKARETAKNLKGMGMSFPDIAKATGLSLAEVKRLS